MTSHELPTTDPRDVGFDPDRLERVATHFRRYVDERRLPGWQLIVARGGKVAIDWRYGHRDVEAGLEVEQDTIFRIYSMTKPLTSVAAMLLYEEGRLDLRHPVSRYIPAFEQSRVLTGGSAMAPVTAPARQPMLVWHLLTHTSGLTYGFHHHELADALYRKAGFEWGSPKGMDLAASCDAWAGLPLAHEPGSRFTYSVSTDVLGRVVEVASGQPLDAFLRERIIEPLDLRDTAFRVDGPDEERLAALYIPNPAERTIVRFDQMGKAATRAPAVLSGGGGLVSTARDYLRFCEMLRRGGELDGVRLLSPRTVAYMTRNHLPGGVDLEQFGQATFAETTFDGVGFGLGFAVVVDPARAKTLCSPGEYAWGGAASTSFFVDPAEEMTAVWLTQLLPSSTYDLRAQLKRLLLQALVD